MDTSVPTVFIVSIQEPSAPEIAYSLGLYESQWLQDVNRMLQHSRTIRSPTLPHSQSHDSESQAIKQHMSICQNMNNLRTASQI